MEALDDNGDAATAREADCTALIRDGPATAPPTDVIIAWNRARCGEELLPVGCVAMRESKIEG